MTTSTRHTQCTRHTNRGVQLACWSKCRLLLTVVVEAPPSGQRERTPGTQPLFPVICAALPRPSDTESRAPSSSSWRRRVSGHRVDRQLGGLDRSTEGALSLAFLLLPCLILTLSFITNNLPLPIFRFVTQSFIHVCTVSRILPDCLTLTQKQILRESR